MKKIKAPWGLFDKIILAIKQEQDAEKTRKLLFGFLFLFIASFVSILFSSAIFINQTSKSGFFYFVFSAFSNMEAFLALWKYFSFAILESLPISGTISFAASFGIFIFTIRLFFHRKKLLMEYLINNFNFIKI